MANTCEVFSLCSAVADKPAAAAPCMNRRREIRPLVKSVMRLSSVFTRLLSLREGMDCKVPNESGTRCRLPYRHGAAFRMDRNPRAPECKCVLARQSVAEQLRTARYLSRARCGVRTAVQSSLCLPARPLLTDPENNHVDRHAHQCEEQDDRPEVRHFDE